MRPDFEKKMEIAQELIKWIESYDRHIVHDSILNYLSEVKESCKEDKLSSLLVSERIAEETEKMKYTNSIFENVIQSLQNKKTIRRLRSVDLGKSRLRTETAGLSAVMMMQLSQQE